MSWTEDDVKRIQEKYGDAAKVTLDDDKTLNIKINEAKLDRDKFVNMWMRLTAQKEDDVWTTLTVIVPEKTDTFEMVKAAAEKYGLQLVRATGEDNRFMVARKPTMKRFWLGWYSKLEPENIPFKCWITGERGGLWDNDPNWAFTYVGDIRAESEEAAFSIAAELFPDYERRFCNEVDEDWQPGTRFQ